MQPESSLQMHYEDLDKQAHAARMGMWIFLGTEILLFGGLFVGYVCYRFLFRNVFHEASRHLVTIAGAVDTVVLLTSSLFAVLSVHFLRIGRVRLVTLCLSLTAAMGVAFLVLHGFEYAHDAGEGALPGRFYHLKELPIPSAGLFFTLYFLMTGLHSFHVVVGVGVVGYMAIRSARGGLVPGYEAPLEVATLYWHLVDVIWIFLFPLLYLV